MTWVTELSSVAAEAPGYVAVIETAATRYVRYLGGPRERQDRDDAAATPRATIQAKMGRSIKKRDMAKSAFRMLEWAWQFRRRQP